MSAQSSEHLGRRTLKQLYLSCESGARREDGSGLEQLCTNKHGLSFFHLLALSIYICLSLKLFLPQGKKLGYKSNCDFKSHICDYKLYLTTATLYITILTFLPICRIKSHKCDFLCLTVVALYLIIATFYIVTVTLYCIIPHYLTMDTLYITVVAFNVKIYCDSSFARSLIDSQS